MTSTTTTDLDQLNVNTIRFLAVDAVDQANSGHPGLPLGAAPMAYVLWDRFLQHDPTDPTWFNRDRFVLSPGHGSAMLYALLHLYGYDLPLDEVRDFRQLGSKTPGHPEYGHTPGVEATTGPLGQGFGMAVGMAMAERFLGAHFNRPGYPIVDHCTYAIVSDGDLMEGVASEAASLAGTLGLHKLVYLYDDNHISIEGDTDIAFRENVAQRFRSYNWHVVEVQDGSNLSAIAEAIRTAHSDGDRPSLIMVRNHIGYGSPKQDTAAVHGEPLGAEAVRATKDALGFPTQPPFHIPDDSAKHFQESRDQGRHQHDDWLNLLDGYRSVHPDEAQQLDRAIAGDLPDGWDAEVPKFESGQISTRVAGGKVMNGIAQGHPTFTGGSADLSPSTKTLLIGHGDFGFDDACGHNLHFGIREHAMAAALNGMALHGGVVPYGATFFVFADYLRPAIRLSAIMQTHVIYVFTHDSIMVGEDGPTHQPVEHLASLRSIPGLIVLRPADANETAAAWRTAMQHRGPSAIILSRQDLPVLESAAVADGLARGAYILHDPVEGEPDVVMIATGSEVSLALDAARQLDAHNIGARVVSMPSWELFRQQTDDYRKAVLPEATPRLAIEAAHPMGWHEFVGSSGDVLALDRFGASGPGSEVYEQLGFSVDNVIARVRALTGTPTQDL